MKRIIYKPNVGETVPDNSISYSLPINGAIVDVIVDKNFTTAGDVLYDSLNGINLPESFIHHFCGWEV